MARGAYLRDGHGNIRYRRSRRPPGLVPFRQIQDDITAKWVTENTLVTNFFGERQNPRDQQPDSSDFRR